MAILELTSPTEDSLSESKARKGSKFEDISMTFFKVIQEVYQTIKDIEPR